jgi:hypothetical protein
VDTNLYRGHTQCLNFHNVAKHCTFDARGTVVPNTATASAVPQFEIKLATTTGAECAPCVFYFEESLLHKFEGSFALSNARNLPVGLQFIRGTRILLRLDVLCSMPSHPAVHVFLTLEWNSLGRASFEVHDSQRDVRLGKLIFQAYRRGQCYENFYT